MKLLRFGLRLGVLLVLTVGLTAQLVTAQGFLVSDHDRMPGIGRSNSVRSVTPVEQEVYAIKEISVEGKLTGQFTEINVSQTFANTTNRTIETSFVFPLPYHGAIDQMTLLVNGKEYPAKLLDAKEARKTYETIVRTNRDPALLEWIGTGMFRTSVFPIPAGETRTVTLRYSQLLRKDGGVVDYLFPMSTAKYTSRPLEKLTISLDIVADHELKSVYSPTHEVEIKRIGDKRAIVKFETKNTFPSTDFRLLYDSQDGELSSKILSFRKNTDEDGYFLLMTTPKIATEAEKPMSKTVLFVVDTSGSMAGKKIDQARESLKFVLDKLNDGDLFNIVTFNGSVNFYEPELMEYNSVNRKKAIDFCDSIRANGGTNINEALTTAMQMLQDEKQPSYLIFLTDGCPTVGEQNEQKIAENVKKANKVRARVFTFGVGYDLNSRLVDQISRDNFGQSDFVLPEESIEEKVSKLYGRISAPVLTGTKWTITKNGESSKTITNQVYPRGESDFFAGEQLIMVGRYSKFGDIAILIQGKVGDEEKTYTFDGNFVEESEDSRYAFIERIWVMRRIGEIIDELDLKGQNKELVDELIALSTKHGILTPYTSFLADDSTNIRDLSRNSSITLENTEMLRETVGMSGVAQRGFKSELQSAMQADSSDSFDAKSRFGGMGGMSGKGMSGSSSATVPSEAVPQQQMMRNVANQAFYLRNGIWEDSSVNESQMKNVIVVKQFSDEYFKMVERHGKELSQYLVFDEPVLVNFHGQAYRFE